MKFMGKNNVFGWLILPVLVVLLSGAVMAASGKIVGSIVDKESGEPLIGASVLVKGTTIGAATDLDGNYIINRVPPGEHVLVVSSVGYTQIEITNVTILEDKAETFDIALERKFIEGKSIKVTAKAVKNTEASLLKSRQHSNTISDAISSEAISRSGSGDAAEAMTKVTGASVVDGKHVYVRGLGGRYGNAKLNGAILPSADPDNQSVQMDLFPTNLLDNITVEKTFTPDKPGSFSGGSVDLKTKDIPEGRTLSFSMSSNYNSITTHNDDFLSTPQGGDNWIAFDADFHEMPALLANDSLINVVAASKRPELAEELLQKSRALSSSMDPIRKKAPLNRSYSFSFGDNYTVGNRPLGLISSLTYSHKYSMYDDGETARWTLVGPGSPYLINDYYFSDAKSTEEVLWGGMLNLNYSAHQNHKLGLQGVYNRQGETLARYLAGTLPKDFTEDERATFETRTIKYTEQWVGNLQMNGEHLLSPVRINWQGSISENDSNEPDHRFFSNHFLLHTVRDELGVPLYDTTVYHIHENIYSAPMHLYRELSEKNREGRVDFEMPIGDLNGRDIKISSGISYLIKSRDVREQRYAIQWQSYNGFSGDPDDFTDTDMYAIDSAGSIILPDFGDDGYYSFKFYNYLLDKTNSRNSYTGKEKIFGVYLMSEFMLAPKLKVVGGVRLENTKMEIQSAYFDDGNAEGDGLIDKDDWLPSVSLTYQALDNMNFRAAFGRTLARPTIRELSPLVSFEFVKGHLLVGNPGLKQTNIDNYDLRWEWFTRPGEIVAISGFYKQFTNPIEKTILNDNFNVMYQNVDEATVYGVEIEFRKSLDFINEFLKYFSAEGNFTLTKSEVDLGAFELGQRLYYDSSASQTRELQGQSPYIFNASLGYDNYNIGTTITVLYNVFGERLSAVNIGGLPDIYEQPRHRLDFTAKHKLFESLSVKFSGKNLLGADMEKIMKYKGEEYVYQTYSKGTSWSLGLSYKI